MPENIGLSIHNESNRLKQAIRIKTRFNETQKFHRHWLDDIKLIKNVEGAGVSLKNKNILLLLYSSKLHNPKINQIANAIKNWSHNANKKARLIRKKY